MECYERSGGMAQGFAYYRAIAKSTKQNETVSRQKLPMPTLAPGGDQATAEKLRESMESFAEHVEGGIIEDCGHYVMEEQPEQVTRRLLAFFNTVEGQR